MSAQISGSPNLPRAATMAFTETVRPESDVPDARGRLRQIADGLREATLNVVWRQWGVLGAGAVLGPTGGQDARGKSDAHRRVQALVDPEALVLVSLTLLEHERRLGDVLHDWCTRNSDLLSVQRMKNLEADYPEVVRGSLTHRLAWFAAVARDNAKDLRWRSLAQTWKGVPSPHPLIAGGSPETASVGDRSFARVYGAQAPLNALTKTRATRARLNASAALMLRLRLGLGVGVKADLIAVLLARSAEWATVREITDATGYTVAAVRRAAEDLATAQLIDSRDGQPARFRAALEAWAPLLRLPDRPSPWASWHERFLFIAAFLHWADEAGERPLSAYAFGANGRRLLEGHRAAFERDLGTVWSTHSPVDDWGSFVSEAVRSLGSWMEGMS